MSSSVELAPSTHLFATSAAGPLCRKRSHGASFGPSAGTDDAALERAAKHPRPHADAVVYGSHGPPSITRWPELYVDSIAASQACDRALAQTRRLHPANISSLVRGEGNRVGVVLGLHGLSAGPWQYAELAQAYARLGLDVYTPRMVGHGLRKDGQPDPAPMPDIEEEDVYTRYAQVVFDNARSYARRQGLPLLFAAHSAGAVLAATLVQKHPEDVAGQVYINPLQAPTAWSARLKFLVARVVRRIGWGHRWLQRARYVFVKDVDHSTWPGYPSMPLSKIYPVLNRARNVWRSFVKTSVPTMLFVSDFDQTCDPVPTLRSAQKFFEHLTVHRFGYSERVGHAMVSAIENPRADVRRTIYDKSGSFLLDCAKAAGRRDVLH